MTATDTPSPAGRAEMLTEAEAVMRAVAAHAHGSGYAGPDAYDGLSGPVTGRLRGKYPRQAGVQLVKRAPGALRRALGIRPMVLVKTLTFFSLGYTRAPWVDPGGRRDDLNAMILARRGELGAWGYEFDVQTRWSFYGANTPNAVVTSFCVEALYDSGMPTGQYATAADALLKHFQHPQGYFRYVPHSDELVYNGSLLAARALERIQPGHPATASTVATVLEGQRTDGLWPYGRSPHLQWVDNYHTAYTLLCLHTLRALDPSIESALGAGVEAWLARCFSPSGEPRFFADKDGPTDVNNVATALYALCRLGPTYSDCSMYVIPTLRRLLALQHGPGQFSVSRNGPVYPRWNQGPAFWALSELLARNDEVDQRSGLRAET